MIRIPVYNTKVIFKDLNDTGYRYNIKVHLQRPK